MTINGKRCEKCLLPRPCWHHEKDKCPPEETSDSDDENKKPRFKLKRGSI